jgi:GNAT superfamily N-acetyltransferase
VWERLAGPADDDGRFGYVQSMATDPAWRSTGVARAVLALLLDGFRERGVGRVGLHATRYGEPLYRSVGFVEPRFPELRLRL